MRSPIRWLLALTLPLVAATIARSQTPPERQFWTPEDIVFAESASDPRIAPDGRWVVWVKSQMDRKTDRRASNLVATSLGDGTEIQLTRGADVATHPRWSPDGRHIAFLFNRKPADAPADEPPHHQIWLMDWPGGEPWPLTHLTRDVQSFVWVGNDSIVFSAEEDPALYEQERKTHKDDTQVVEDAAHTPPVRLFRISLKDHSITRLSQNRDWIRLFDVSPDGHWAVTVNQQSLAYEWDQRIPPKTFLVDLTTGQMRPIFTEGRIVPRQVRWAPDGSGIYAVTPYSTSARFLTATINLVYFYDVASGRAEQVDVNWPNGLAESDLVVTRDGFLALLADGVRFRPARYTRQGPRWQQHLLTGEHAANIFGWTLGADDRTLVYEYTTASRPPQLFTALLEGTTLQQPRQLTHLNPSYAQRTIARSEVVHWKGANDEEVDGVLYYPHDYRPGQRYPLVLMIHGGPTGYDIDGWEQSWAYPIQLFTQRGAFVLKANYHGSGNHGLAWAESICCGRYYTLEVPDLDRGVDALIARGLVDPTRVATQGWSNGAILSIQLAVSRPDRYRVLSAGAGDVEWISDWANVDFGESFDAYYFGASPIENPQLYVEKSPFFKVNRIQAPTIIFQGTEDRNVPTDQSWDFYRALYWTNKVPVKFLLFPGEPHGLLKATHQLSKIRAELEWFDRYFFTRPAEENEALKAGSPLSALVQAARVGTRYGVAFRPQGAAEPVLIPEVVRWNGLEVGRFEVTRAQFAAFDPNYRYPAGTDNYPANNISFEQARAYCEWLSRLTGQHYRLPTEAEAEKLYAPTNRAGQNTLDYWAGYAVNPDDLARLAPVLQHLAPDALLRPVGSFAASVSEGDDAVYDLGGNVAEWVTGASGQGIVRGGSADRPADPKLAGEPAPAYTGFRVIRVAVGEGSR
jgi:dipeptidyl aminopeptidase/acylaminoacyl peptidase